MAYLPRCERSCDCTTKISGAFSRTCGGCEQAEPHQLHKQSNYRSLDAFPAPAVAIDSCRARGFSEGKTQTVFEIKEVKAPRPAAAAAGKFQARREIAFLKDEEQVENVARRSIGGNGGFHTQPRKSKLTLMTLLNPLKEYTAKREENSVSSQHAHSTSMVRIVIALSSLAVSTCMVVFEGDTPNAIHLVPQVSQVLPMLAHGQFATRPSKYFRNWEN